MTDSWKTQEATYAAMCEALDDEYKARATYRGILDTFGDVRPFSNIVEAEERHIQALLGLFDARRWQAPPDVHMGRTPVPATLREACAAGVEAEIENDALYRRLAAMTDDAEVLRVFQNLRRASAERHLPAFQRCVDRNGAAAGRGQGRHRRRRAGQACGGGRGGFGRCAVAGAHI